MNKRRAVRIISGSRKGSKIHFPEVPGLRPTGDRIRETLFAWLQPSIVDCSCLDMFAGSGALGFEAASRGAARTVMIEKNPAAVEALNENAARLGFSTIEVIASDALTDLPYKKQLSQSESHQGQSSQGQSSLRQFNLVLIDPPFSDNLHADAIACVLRNNILTHDAWVYLESSKRDEKIPVPENWELHREKVAGEIRMLLYRVIADS